MDSLTTTKELIPDIQKLGVYEALLKCIDPILYQTKTSLLLTGSSALFPTSKKFTNGCSDIDTILVAKDSSEFRKVCDKLEVMFSEDFEEYQALDIIIKYGDKRNEVHLSCITRELYHQIVSFKPINLTIFRPKSLTLFKQVGDFYTSSKIQKVYYYTYLEKKVEQGFELSYIFDPKLKDGEIMLSDWHSRILISRVIKDTLGIKNDIKKYKVSFLEKFNSLDSSDQANLLWYFNEKHNLTSRSVCNFMEK